MRPPRDVDVYPGIRIRVTRTTCSQHPRCVDFGVLEWRNADGGHKWLRTDLSMHVDASAVPAFVAVMVAAALDE